MKEDKVQVIASQVRPQKSGAGDLLKDYKEKMGELLDLTESQRTRLVKRLKKEVNAWEGDTSELHDRLQYFNDLLEGMTDDSNLPFEGASHVHIPIVAIYCKVYHSIERRSILGADEIWYLDSTESEIENRLADIDTYLNFKARSQWNIKQAISDVMWVTNRDGLAFLDIYYALETEQVEDTVCIASPQDFQDEFPSPEEAGLNPKEYAMLAQEAMMATEEVPLEVPVTYEQVKYRGPKADVVELADFVIFPATARSLERRYARGYGKRFSMLRSEVKRLAQSGEWYKDETMALLKKNKNGSDPSDYRRSSEQHSGLNRTGKNGELEFFGLTYWFDLDQGKEAVKLQLIFSAEHETLVMCKMFPYRVCTMIPYYIDKKPNQLIGNSVPGGLTDIQEEVNEIHNRRNNSRKIVEVPSFKAKRPNVKDFDPNAFENAWRPGVIFWLDNPEAFEQFQVQPVDFGTSMQEEQADIKISSMRMGVDPFLFSGNVQPDDPEAPGNKTLALIGQANLRMDDPLAELRSGVEETGRVCLALEYQFGPPILEFEAEESGQKIKKYIPKRLLRKGLNVHMHGITVALNPDSEFIKWIAYYRTLVAEPLIGNSAKRRVEILRNALRNGRVPGREKILPSIEEIEQEEINYRKQAIMQIAQEQQVQQQEQAKAAQDQAMMAQKDQAIQSKAKQAMAKDNMDALAGKVKQLELVSRAEKAINGKPK